MDITECQERTVAWVNTSSPIRDNVTPPPSHPRHTPEDGHTPGDRHTSEDAHTPENRHTPKDGHTPSNGNTPKERITAIKGQTSTEIPETTVDCVSTQREVYPNQHIRNPERCTPVQHAFSYYPPPGLMTPSGLYSSVPLETFTASNQQLIATLVKQNLLKCHPDVETLLCSTHGKDRLR